MLRDARGPTRPHMQGRKGGRKFSLHPLELEPGVNVGLPEADNCGHSSSAAAGFGESGNRTSRDSSMMGGNHEGT